MTTIICIAAVAALALFVATRRGPVYSERVSFTQYQLRNVNSINPLTVVSSPGRGKAIQLISASFQFSAGDVPFSFTNDMALLAGSIDVVKPQLTLPAAVINSSYDQLVSMTCPNEFGSIKEDAPIMFGTVGGANVSLEAEGTVVIDVMYRVVRV